jgi:hypothetical protein
MPEPAPLRLVPHYPSLLTDRRLIEREVADHRSREPYVAPHCQDAAFPRDVMLRLRSMNDRWTEVRPGVLVDKHEPPALFVQHRNAQAAAASATAYTHVAQDKSRVHLATAPIVDVASTDWVGNLPLQITLANNTEYDGRKIFDAAADMVRNFQSVGLDTFNKRNDGSKAVRRKEPRKHPLDFRAFRSLRCRMRFPYTSLPLRPWAEETAPVVHVYQSASKVNIDIDDLNVTLAQPIRIPHSSNHLCECSKCAAFFGPFSYLPDVPMYGGVSEFGWSKFDELLRGQTFTKWGRVHSSLKHWAHDQTRHDSDPNLRLKQRLHHPHSYRIKAKFLNEHYDKDDINAGVAAPVATKRTYRHSPDNEIGLYKALTATPSSMEFNNRELILDYKMARDREACEFELESLRLGYPPSFLPLQTDRMRRISGGDASLYLPVRPHQAVTLYFGKWDEKLQDFYEESPNYYAFGVDLRTPSRELVWDEELQEFYEVNNASDVEKLIGDWDDPDTRDTAPFIPGYGFADIDTVNKRKRTAARGYPRRPNQKIPWWKHYWPGSVMIYPVLPEAQVEKMQQAWLAERGVVLEPCSHSVIVPPQIFETDESKRYTTGWKDEMDRIQEDAAGKMKAYLLNLKRKVPLDVIQELMTGRRTYDAVVSEFNVNHAYLRKCVHDATVSVSDIEKTWSGEVEEPGIYGVVHLYRAPSRLVRIAATDAGSEAIYDGFHNLVVDVMEAKAEKGRLNGDDLSRAYFDVACEFTRFLPWRILPEPADQTPALKATELIVNILLNSPFAED